MRDELAEGQVLAGKYRVDRLLARGGMGLVFVAHHMTLRQRVAIKVLDSTLLRSAEVVVRFEREARLAVKIKSEHVAQILDVSHLESGAPYIVMEYLEGEDLARRLAEHGPLSVEEAVDYVLQAGVAIADAHAAGIVHRDLKPGNLVCVRRSDGRALVKVLDFGISKWAGDDHEPEGVSVTRTEQVLGSPLYMSPEQVQSSRDVDLRTDIWSLGAVLFELVAGRPPFTGETFGEVAVRIATQPPPALASLRPEAQPLDSVITRCLARDRRHRYSSMAELAQALLPFAGAESRSLVARIQRIPGASGAAAPAEAAYGPEAVQRDGGVTRTHYDFRHAMPSHAPTETTIDVSAQTVTPWAQAPSAARNRRALFGGASLALAALVALGAAALSDDEPVEAGAAATVATAIQAAEAAPQPTPAPPASSAAVVVPMSSASPGASSSGTLAPPTKSTSQTRAKLRPAAAAVRPPAAVSSPQPAPEQAAKAKTNCDPPYVVDERGRRHFKPECYLNRP